MSHQGSKSRTASIVLVVIIALLFWSELVFSNLPSLSDLATPTATLGWTTGATRFYFIVLSVLNVVGGVAAVLFLVALIRKSVSAQKRSYLLVLVTALVLYGAYQFITAFRLPASLQAIYWGIGVVYVAFGAAMYALNRR